MPRYFIAIARAIVNHDGEYFSVGSVPERRKVVHAVRDRAFVPGPAGIWCGKWVVLGASPFTCRDIELWPCSAGMFVKWVAFLCTLHWPQGDVSLGVGGVSFVEVLILYELWAGERLDLEMAVHRYRRAVRSISVSVVPFVQALIFGDLAGTLGLYFVLLLLYLMVFVGLFLVMLVQITVGFGTLGGKGVVMASPPGLLSLWVCCCVVE